MPIPPNHWVSERQKRIPCGSPSTWENTVAPVVVNPETDSKSAATGDWIVPESTYGRAPAAPTASHARETTAYPSLTVRSRSSCVRQ